MISFIKETGKPSFLEYLTYRSYGHVGPNGNLDVGVRRKPEDIAFWERYCPIKRMHEALVNSGVEEETMLNINGNIDRDIEEAVKLANLDPYPDSSELLDNVYSRQGGNV